jgi:hypothetical protein
MDASERNKLFYWILTILVLAPTAGSGIPELFTRGPAMTVQSFHLLGYPLYLLKILGLAKILGAVAILTGRLPKMKEWRNGPTRDSRSTFWGRRRPISSPATPRTPRSRSSFSRC